MIWNIDKTQNLQVLQESNARKEELKMRAVALKILGKFFQVAPADMIERTDSCSCL